MMLLNCSGERTSVSATTVNSRADDSMRPGRNLRVLPADRVLDVLHGQLVAGEARAVEVDAHRHLPLAEDAHVGGARQHRQPRLHVALDVVGRLERRQRARLRRRCR